MKFALGENPKFTYNERNTMPITRMGISAIIRENLQKTQHYLELLEKFENDPENNEKPEFDAKLHALIPVLRREIQAHFHCHRADDIFTAIRISKEFKLDLVLVHATEGYLIAENLAKESCSAIVGPLITDCSKPELRNQDLSNAAILLKNGIKVAICTDHPETPIQYLGITAAAAMKGGLSFDDAMRCTTVNAAKILGISDRIGTLQPGKDADFQIYNSLDIFGMFSKPTFVYINGKKSWG
jgi:imidazolonepropionase-like amidohydrolase